jgi:RNA polymerase sigma-70 factor (ECF subfamily)
MAVGSVSEDAAIERFLELRAIRRFLALCQVNLASAYIGESFGPPLETSISMTDPEFRDAFLRHKDVLYRFAFRMTGSRPLAEDVVQESFLALWRRPGAYDSDRGSVRAFLLGIARNLILKNWRDERPYEELDEQDSVCGPVDLPAGELASIVAWAIARLPPLQREALILAEYEDMSLEEIGRATGTGLAAVKSRLHRAKKSVRRLLAPRLNEKGTPYGAK